MATRPWCHTIWWDWSSIWCKQTLCNRSVMCLESISQPHIITCWHYKLKKVVLLFIPLFALCKYWAGSGIIKLRSIKTCIHYCSEKLHWFYLCCCLGGVDSTLSCFAANDVSPWACTLNLEKISILSQHFPVHFWKIIFHFYQHFVFNMIGNWLMCVGKVWPCMGAWENSFTSIFSKSVHKHISTTIASSHCNTFGITSLWKSYLNCFKMLQLHIKMVTTCWVSMWIYPFLNTTAIHDANQPRAK